MAKKLQLRGGTTAQHATFTGALREVTVDTDKDTLVVHDGSTAGGHTLTATDDYSETIVVPTAGQTTFPHVYVVGRVQVFMNGVKLLNGAANDFEATNGTTIELATGATILDTMEFINF
tara:strand:- start:11686 stop:12042 length:357 start_codon:yes stop_codon:yes gene_type:complete